MEDRLKQFIDKVLYALIIAELIFFAFGMIFSISTMARMGLWLVMFTCAGVAGMAVYEYLWRNQDPAKELPLLVQMIAAVVITLAVIALTIFIFNGKINILP